MAHPVLIYTDREKEILNPVMYAELRRRGLLDTQICLKYHIREGAMKKFKRELRKEMHHVLS